MKCNCIPCGKEGIYLHMINIGDGLIGQAWFCYEHLPKLSENKK